jgi:hypothetical protein
VTLNPATDPNRAQMIRCHMQHWAHNIVLSSVPAGTYDVYLYTWLDWADPNPATFGVQLEGQTVQTGVRVAGLGEWRRIGPYRAAINDGTINLTTTGGIANLSGVEVYRVVAGGSSPTNTPTQTVPPAATATATHTPTTAPITLPTSTATHTSTKPPTSTATSTPIATTSVPTNPPTSGGASSFFRAINLNGPALVIDGNSWEGSTAPNYSAAGSPFCAPWAGLVPSTDTARTQMIQCSVQHWEHNLVLSSVPAGSYDVYLYIWMDWANPNPDTFGIQLEGQTVQTGIRVAGLGEWRRIGPYRAAINDGTINITSTGGVANLSGIEVFRVGGTNMTSTATATATNMATAIPVTNTPTNTATIAPTSTPGSTVTAVPTNPPTSGGASSFFRAINLNGPALVIDGNSWEGSTAANYSISGMTFCNPWVALVPTTDTNRAQMIQCSVQHWAHNLVLSGVPAGTYQVYLYIWMDWANPRPDSFNVQVEGLTVDSGIRVSGLGEWRRIGPYQSSIVDGTLNLTTTGGVANLSGVEVYRVGGQAMNPVVQTAPQQLATIIPGSAPFESAPAAPLEQAPPTLMPTATPAGVPAEGMNTEAVISEQQPEAMPTGIPAGG